MSLGHLTCMRIAAVYGTMQRCMMPQQGIQVRQICVRWCCITGLQVSVAVPHTINTEHLLSCLHGVV